MSILLRRAFVLHRRPFKNTSLLLELFVEGEGRFPAVSRGGAKGSTAGLLQPFTPLRLGWGGRGEVKSLHEVEPDDYQLDRLVGKPLFCGLYLNELLMRLVPRSEPHDQLFGDYIRTLSSLVGEIPLDWSLRLFEMRLLQAAGYELVTDVTLENEPVEPGRNYLYQKGRGFSESPVELSADTSNIISGRTLIALHNKTCDDIQLRQEAKQLLRRVIDYHLDYNPLKSRELFG
ncbi:DNA repair protein RecO [Solemya velum gill symbiont]|uniref:DNA repair protein RecO n=1 Tax=Solemya velum gill symbiont TaxID=2340 RepID=UPI000998BDB9|nr:DNA repair protein RecO [Solemya velum gill symbiont]OOY55601.1 DNA repair protein RecO [Solemya velum gill symbiont]OOY57004.1 DNA repair protein RecO [Solemya velum gill symbiont]OOY94169.1 DNA repair protein RecO [Solemya velum gill symbiont]